VFGVGGDGAIWWTQSNSGSFSSLGGRIISNPAAVTTASNSILVFGVGGDNGAWVHMLA
jgi:hypothetical protein